jgi:hypothetical protein
MLTPLQLKSNYFSLLADSKNITGMGHCSYMRNKYDYINITEDTTFTTEQWDNLVKVASIIKANENRFDMTEWHDYNDCGTTHCIAGWAVSLAMNDTNFDGLNSTCTIAIDMLSKYVEPFFWVTTFNLDLEDIETYKGLAEKLVMKWFIDPILEEARKESYELSNEITQFIQKAQKETQMV